MRLLFDVVHPADVHFFRWTITGLIADGHQVMVTSRVKDIAIALLVEFGLEHQVLSTKDNGVIGLMAELARRNLGLLKCARRFRPQVLVGNNSPSVAHIGYLLRRPTIVFDDTEINHYCRLLYRPFVSEIHTPECFRLDLGPKQIRYKGQHALAYLHPDRFRPDPAVAESYGLGRNEPFFLFRFVHWGAAHDLGVSGLSDEAKLELVTRAEARGRVVVNAEGRVPDALIRYQLPIRPTDMHHLMASAAGLIGESATMCAEAACLGCPSLLIDRFGRGYTDQLERDYRLMERQSPSHWPAVLEATEHLFRRAEDRADMERRRQRLVADMIDVSAYQRAQILRLAETAEKGA